MEAKDRTAGNMLVIIGMILFLAGIGGMGCAVWMPMSIEGPLWLLSILVGLVSILIIIFGYVLIGEGVREVGVKGERTSIVRLSKAAKNKFICLVASIYGLILFVPGTLFFVIGALQFFWSSDSEFKLAGGLTALAALIPLLCGLFLLLWVFRFRKAIRKSISKG